MPKPNFMRSIAIFFFSAFLLVACSNRDASGAAVDGNAYVFFKISGEEEKENVTCLLQYFTSDTAGKSVLLAPPATVLLDSEAVPADSTSFTGAYYEAQKPLQNFAGAHTIVYQDAAGKQFQETFNYAPFTLNTDLGERVKKAAIQLQVTGLQPKDSLQVILVDTSFATMDIDRLQLAENGSLPLTKTDLEKLKAGPVTLYLIKETERPVKNSKGKIRVSYSLKREFELVD